MIKNSFKILTFVGFWLISECNTLETLSLNHSDNRIKSVQRVITEDTNQSHAIAVGL
ncbi:hypothetical protein GTH32_15695 [Alteromonas sp. 345S023]|uniref:Uncharacterized protein n=1 Tax=Alteromonas profundi TaxID=2696062 RepID=A0A7X5LNG7_9ALTE|nr:hypothetical protein [Alteromonas profundi]NDV92618.1 hypothetical protein [Alteromonas profundi]